MWQGSEGSTMQERQAVQLKHRDWREHGEETRFGQGSYWILREMGGHWRVLSREVPWSDFGLVWLLCKEWARGWARGVEAGS